MTAFAPSATASPAANEAVPHLRDLAEAACEPNPFFHPALLAPALAHLDASHQVRLIEAHDEQGQLVGMLPVVPLDRHGNYRIRNVASWVHDQCFYAAPLLRADRAEDAWAALLDQLDGADWSGGFLHIRSLAVDGPAAKALLACCAAQGRPVKCIATHERAQLKSGLSADQYWQTHVRPKKRKELRRLANRLDDMGTVKHRCLTSGDELPSWIRDFLALERSGWKGTEGTALDSSEETRSYFTAALTNAWDAGILDMLRIDLDEAPVAMLVNFRMRPGSFSYKIAFDERFARFSPGVLIELDNLRAALSDPGLAWMDSCAAPNHPMIDGIWAERRTIGQFRVALRGKGMRAAQRRAVFAATGFAEEAVTLFRKIFP